MPDSIRHPVFFLDSDFRRMTTRRHFHLLIYEGVMLLLSDRAPDRVWETEKGVAMKMCKESLMIIVASRLRSATVRRRRPRPIRPKRCRSYVSFAPGGAWIASPDHRRQVTESLGQPSSSTTAGSERMIGTDVAAKAPPDGYTLLLGTQTVLVVAPILYGKTTFDPLKLFSPWH